MKESNKCIQCKSTSVDTSFSFSKIVMFDLLLYKVQKIKLNSINDIPTQFVLFNTTFEFVGCIEFVGNCKLSLQHYVAHIKRKNNIWETYDDLLAKIEKPNCNKKRKVQVIIYIQK